MAQRYEIDVRDITRVISAGVSSYLLVHFLLLPQLIKMGVTFPACFYIGVVATGLLSVAISFLIRARTDTRDGAPQAGPMHPAQ